LPVGSDLHPVIFFFYLVFEIEIPYPIRTCHDAIPAAYASPEVLDYDSIRPVVSCFCRANGDAGGVSTMHAGHRDQGVSGCRIFSFTHRDYPVPVDFPSPFLFGG
jgi:hypothetical protein